MTSVKLSALVSVSAALLIGGTFLLSGLASTSAQSPRLAELQGSGVLDGMAFESHLGPVGQPADVSDTLSFSNGLFLSAECERRCNYPARPYFTRENNGRIEFISETRCPDKDATLVWRGSVDNGTIEGGFTWTSSRWYWTFEKQFRFQGKLAGTTASTEQQ